MTTLHLGFHEVPHFGDKTADQVAKILEEKYKVVETFYNQNEDKIVEALVESYANAINSIELGADPHTCSASGPVLRI